MPVQLTASPVALPLADCSARDGSIVVAVVERELIIRMLDSDDGTCKLKAGALTYPDIVPPEGQTLEIWGVVTSCIKHFAK